MATKPIRLSRPEPVLARALRRPGNGWNPRYLIEITRERAVQEAADARLLMVLAMGAQQVTSK